METIFANIGMGGRDERLNAEDEFIDLYEAKVKALIVDAVDYNESDLSPDRQENMKLYTGEYPALEAPAAEEIYGDPDEVEPINRSTAVSTDVRDTVMSVMPSLMRIFASSENVVNFVPSTAQGEAMAKQATQDVIYTFWEDNEGFLTLHNTFKDVMISKIGIVRWWTDDDDQMMEKEFQNITLEQLQAVIQEVNEGYEEPRAKIVDQDEVLRTFDRENNNIPKVRVQYLESKPVHRIAPVAPEDFRIDRRATSVKTARLIGSTSVVAGSDLVQMGYSKELVDQYTGSYDYYSVEKSIRVPGIDTSVIDRDLVEYGEYFVRIDKDGDGVDELHLICTMGSNFDIVKDDIVDHVQLAVFCGDPEPHTVVGSALADLTKDIQVIKTQLLRGALDGLSGSMFPDLIVNETLVNIQDVMADGIGRVIRTKGDPNGTVREMRASFAGGEIFEMMGTMDLIRQSRTGISEASKGVDPKALQSTNLMGIDAIVTGAQERIELIARILAETGFKDMMRGLLRLIVNAPNKKRTMKLTGGWVEYDQSTYDPNLTCKVNPMLGKGSDMARIGALAEIQAMQQTVVQQMGIMNPIVTPEQLLNTVKDRLAIVNIKDTTRYFNDVTPEMLQQLSGPKEPSPEEILAKAELEGVKQKTIATIAKTRYDTQKMYMDDDFKRDQLGLQTLVDLVTSLATDPSILQQVPAAEAIVEAGNQPNAATQA